MHTHTTFFTHSKNRVVLMSKKSVCFITLGYDNIGKQAIFPSASSPGTGAAKWFSGSVLFRSAFKS